MSNHRFAPLSREVREILGGYDFRPCLFDERLLGDLKTTIGLPRDYEMRIPEEAFLYDGDVDGWIGIPVSHFRYGLRFSSHQLIREICKDYLHIPLGQLLPNFVLLLNAFIAHCIEKQVCLTATFFFYVFRMQKSLTAGF